MASDLKKVGLIFKADGTADFTASLKQVNQATRENYSTFKLAKSQWDSSTSSLKKLKDTQSYLASQTQSYASKVNVLTAELDELENAEKRDEDAIAKKKNQLNNAQTSLNNYKRNLNEVTAALESGQAQIEEYAKKIENFGNKTKQIGGTLSKTVTAPIAGVEAAAVKVGSEFEASMSKVQATAGASAKELEALKNKAKEMGATTKFSASESADAMNYMAMAGWNSQQMIDGLPGILNLAAASGEDLATTSDIVTDALTAFGLKAEDSSHFADVLAKTSSSANTNVSLMGETFKYVAPLAGTLGFSVEDTSLAIGLMANAGIKGSQAGTALKTAIANMVSPTDSMKGKMDQLGISVTDSNGKMKPLIQILQELREKFGKLDKAQQSSAASTIFGKESMSGMLAIINASDKDFNNLYKNISNSDCAAKKMSKTMQNNLKGDLTTLKSALEGLGIKISEVLTPAIRSITKAITEWCSWLNGLDDGLVKVIVGIGTIAAAIGPILVLIGTLAGPLSTAVSLFGQLKLALFGATESAGMIGKIVAMLSPQLVIIIGVIALVVGAVVSLWNTSEGFRNAVIDIGTQIMTVLGTIWAVIQPIIEMLKVALNAILQEGIMPLWNAFQDLVGDVVETVSYLFDILAPIIDAIILIIGTALVPTIQGLIVIVVAVINAIIGACTGFVSSLSPIINNITTILQGIINFITGVFTGNWRNAWQGISDIFNGIFGAIGGICKAVINTIVGLINGAIGGINSMIDGLNKISFDVPDWVPGIGGKSFGIKISHIGKIPALAKGGNLLKGSAIVGEAGMELLTQNGNQTRVTPLTSSGGSNREDLIDYKKMAMAIVSAIAQSGLKFEMDKRELGKLIRSEAY